MHLALTISSLAAGGAERVLTELANYWVSKEHRVSLVTLASPDTPPFYPLDPRVELIQLGQAQHIESFLKRLKHILGRIFCLRTTLRRLHPDVVVSFVDVMNITTLLASYGLKIPVVVSERTDPNQHILPPFYRWLRWKVYPWARALIVQTSAAADYFPAAFKEFLTVIPNAVVESTYFKKEHASQARCLITVGRLSAEKDHETLLRAFAAVHVFYPHLQLTIYGEGSEREALEQLVRNLNLENHVQLPGAIQGVHEALADADIFIFPSRYEGFPNALCEAMGVGLPVVVSDCSGNRAVVTDGLNGRLFPVGDEAALKMILMTLIENPHERQRLGQNAREISKQLHPTRILKMWDDVVTPLFSSKKHLSFRLK